MNCISCIKVTFIVSILKMNSVCYSANDSCVSKKHTIGFSAGIAYTNNSFNNNDYNGINNYYYQNATNCNFDLTLVNETTIKHLKYAIGISAYERNYSKIYLYSNILEPQFKSTKYKNTYLGISSSLIYSIINTQKYNIDITTNIKPSLVIYQRNESFFYNSTNRQKNIDTKTIVPQFIISICSKLALIYNFNKNVSVGIDTGLFYDLSANKASNIKRYRVGYLSNLIIRIKI